MAGVAGAARNVVRMRLPTSTDQGVGQPPAASATREPRTLTQDLRWRSDAQLTELLRARPDLLDPVPANLSQLASQACSTVSVHAALDSLDRPTLQVLARLAGKPGALSISELALECGVADWQQLVPFIETLRSRALVWGNQPDHAAARLQTVVSVREVVRGSDQPGAIDLSLRTPGAVTSEPDDSSVGAGPVEDGSERALKAINAVRWICEAWLNEAPTVLKSGGVGQREVNLVCDRAGCTTDEAIFWVSLVESARMVRLAGPPTGFVSTDRVRIWLGLEHADQWALLVSAWALDSTPRGADRVKRLIFGWLAELGLGSRIAIEELVAALADVDPRGEQPVLRRRAVEALRQAEWLGLTTGGRLNEMGRALARAAGSDPEALRAALSNSVAACLPVPTSEFVIQADFTVVVAGLPHPMVRSGLLRLGIVESAGSATVVRLTESKIAQAVESGWAGSDIERFLSSHSRTPVPQPVSYVIADAAARVTDRVRADDAADADPAASGVRTSRGTRARPNTTTAGEAAGTADGGCDVAPVAAVLWAIRQADDAVQNGRAAGLSSDDVTATGRAKFANPAPSAAAVVGALIRSAMSVGDPLLVGHVDPVGAQGSGVVLALRIGGGSVQVFDREARQVRSLVLSRISGVTRLPAEAWPQLPRFGLRDHQ